jgi:lipoprotein-releasing system permease protein
MSAELYLARRYLLNRRHGAWGWLIGWMATGSVALGVGALIVTLAVMTGFREDIRGKILGVQPHVILTTFTGQFTPNAFTLDALFKQNGHIRSWSPYVSGQVLMGHGSQNSGALVKGINVATEMSVARLAHKLSEGSWNVLSSSQPSVVLGVELARNLGARIGDTVWVVTPGSIGFGAMSVPEAHVFRVGGLLQSGLYDYDSSLAYISLAAGQKLFEMGNAVSGVGMSVDNVDQSDVIARDLQKKAEGAYWVRSWLSLNKNLFSALRLEKTVMFIILIMITLVASVMIVSNLLLSITQKTKEIGILRAMGADGKTIHRIFLLQGALMGVVGTGIGAALGILIAFVLAKTNLIRLPADVYYIDKLPISVSPVDVATVVVAACVIVVLATLYPAKRATEIDPLDAIRYG